MQLMTKALSATLSIMITVQFGPFGTTAALAQSNLTPGQKFARSLTNDVLVYNGGTNAPSLNGRNPIQDYGSLLDGGLDRTNYVQMTLSSFEYREGIISRYYNINLPSLVRHWQDAGAFRERRLANVVALALSGAAVVGSVLGAVHNRQSRVRDLQAAQARTRAASTRFYVEFAGGTRQEVTSGSFIRNTRTGPAILRAPQPGTQLDINGGVQIHEIAWHPETGRGLTVMGELVDGDVWVRCPGGPTRIVMEVQASGLKSATEWYT